MGVVEDMNYMESRFIWPTIDTRNYLCLLRVRNEMDLQSVNDW